MLWNGISRPSSFRSFNAVNAVSEEGAAPLDEASVLVFPSHVQADAFPCEEALALLRASDAQFPVAYEFLRSAVCSDPKFIDGGHEVFFGLTGDELCRMPAGAAINHVEDDVLVYEQQITLHLRIERICNLDVAGVAGPWARPFPANLACLRDLRKHL